MLLPFLYCRIRCFGALFLSDDNRLKPVFQHACVLILRIGKQDDNLGTIFQLGAQTHAFVIGKRTLGKR